MQILSDEQVRRAVEAMQSYLAAPRNSDGLTVSETSRQRDKTRVSVIETELNPLLQEYLCGTGRLGEFKSRIDSINKRNQLWGFKGIKGQMFFNMLTNVADNEAECDKEIKAAISVPDNDDTASARINSFLSYARRVGQEHVDSGGTLHGRPKLGSIPFFLSYFWQIQDKKVWPVYYTNSVNKMTDLNLWQPSEDLAADYVTYKKIQEELAEVFSKASGVPFGLYDVEHVFWFHGGNPFGGNTPTPRAGEPRPGSALPPIVKDTPELLDRLPESYVPPIVSILTLMARNEPAVREAAKASGTSIERAFEKSISAAFTLLGYDTKLLGQGQGRVPDGVALAVDDSYAIVWDGKVRADSYSMGTDDRAIKEYIVSQSRELKRRKGLRNVYYVVVSSQFADDYDDTIRSIKMDTEVDEVCLVQADALVAMVDAKMRAPLQVSLGPDGVQRLFAGGGVLTGDDVREAVV